MKNRSLLQYGMTGVFVLGIATLATLVLTGSAFASGVGGCVDSPENPTWILGGLGTVAAGLPWLRARFGRRRNK
jgi:XrtJ-associated TM-motif-TM protein